MTGPDALAQLVGVGVVWMGVHCAGMCGPLLIGLDVGGVQRGAGPARSAARMLGYQGGRALVYAVLGALAGTLGAGLAEVSSRAGAALAGALGVVALARALRTLAPRRRDLVRIGGDRSTSERIEGWLAALARPLVTTTSAWRPVGLGALLAFLPCMIALWALGLAALTASPLWGAIVMLALVALTTPFIVAVGVAVRLLRAAPRWARDTLPAVLLALSGAWLVGVALAGFGLVPHVHIALGGGYVVMIF